jgi:hypothetical protein
MPKVSFRMASASRESVFGVQTNTARKIHRSDHTVGRLTTTPSGCCVRKGRATGDQGSFGRQSVAHRSDPAAGSGNLFAGVQPETSDPSASGGLSAELPAGHDTATGQHAYLEAESQSVASEVEVKEVAALGRLAVSLREHLDEHAAMHRRHASEFLQRSGPILVSNRICDPHPDKSDQCGLLAKGSQTPKECVLSLCQGREVNKKRPG